MSRERNYPLPSFENLRLKNLRGLDVASHTNSPVLNDVVKASCDLMQTPAAFISFMEAQTQIIVAAHGMELTSTPRELSFCTHTILDPSKTLVVPDALLSKTFKYHPYVVAGPMLRSYAGAPIISPDHGFALGSLCVVDMKPRHFSKEQLAALTELSKIVTLTLKAA